MLSATTFQGYKKCCMLAMDVWCFSKSTIRVDLEKHQTRLHYWGNSLCNFEESPLQLWGILLYNKQPEYVALILRNGGSQSPDRWLKEPRNNHLITDLRVDISYLQGLCDDYEHILKEHGLL